MRVCALKCECVCVWSSAGVSCKGGDGGGMEGLRGGHDSRPLNLGAAVGRAGRRSRMGGPR